MVKKMLARLEPGDVQLIPLGVEAGDREPHGYKFFVDDKDEIFLVDDDDLCVFCRVEHVLVGSQTTRTVLRPGLCSTRPRATVSANACGRPEARPQSALSDQ